MSDLALAKTKILEGVWEGVLSYAGEGNYQPEIAVTHLEQPLNGVEVVEDQPAPGQWLVRVPIPASALCDGVQTFLIRDARTGDTLDRFTLITGSPAEDDLRAEVELLRAELDMLKKAFRRHCLETAGR